jgi:hypothetical protein
MVSLYDNPQSHPEFAGYDAFGRPLYNRNARQKALGFGGSLGEFDFGPSTMTTETMGGGGSGMFGAVQSAGSLAKNVRDAYNEGAPTQFGYGTAAGGLLNPTEFGAYGPPPSGYSGPAFNSDWAAADAIDSGIDPSFMDFAETSPLNAAPADAGGGLMGSAGEAMPYIGAALSLYDMAANGFSGRNGLGLASSVMPMIGMAGGPGLAAMTALISLGGGFDPDTARMGIGSDFSFGPDGRLSAPDWIDTSNYGASSPRPYYSFADQIYNAINSGPVDPSWMKPGAGLSINYGSDADIGLENPLAQIVFRSGDFAPGDAGRQGNEAWGGDAVNVNWMLKGSPSDILSQIAQMQNPLLSAAPTFAGSPLGIEMGRIQNDMSNGDIGGVPDWWAYRMAQQALGGNQAA